jgi:Tfp pilus assembly protein PilZ
MTEPLTPWSAESNERRSEPRFHLQQEANCLLELDDQVVTAWIQNVSGGGVSLQTTRPLELGTRLQIPLQVPGLPKLELVARVVHCTPVQGRWWVGCRFGTRLREEQLRAIRTTAPPAEGKS